MNNGKNICKVICFVLVAVLLFTGLGSIFVQNWDSVAYELYDEPDNTIETIFLGSSMTQFSIDTMKLYEDYGICSYNMGTLGQPVLASYYWLEEVYRLHSKSLKTVVFDISLLRKVADEVPMRMTIDYMEMSPVKYRAIDAYVEDFNDKVSYFFPLFSYHDRWSELKSTDFGESDVIMNSWGRGYYILTSYYLDKVSPEEVEWPEYELDTNAQMTELNDEAVDYLYKMINFCEKNNLELILLRTPGPLNWSSSDHNAVAQILDNKDVEFLDFNFEPLMNELDYDYLLDSYDGIHLNYYGAQKFTTWIGNYLIENGYATDVRENQKYAFLEEQLEDYYRDVVNVVKLRGCTDPTEYLSLASNNENYTIFIMGKDDASNALTDEQRLKFEKLGLNKLKELSFQDSYLAVIDAGKVVYEASEGGNKESINTGVSISYQGELREKSIYTITSGGTNLGNIAECFIEGVQYAKNKRGLNIVIFDNHKRGVVDSAVFDTYVSNLREAFVEKE